MTQLLARYPELTEWLKAEIKRRPLLFSPSRNSGLQVNGLHAMHRQFLNQCRALGLRESDYPLVKDQQGIRALSIVVKRLGAETFRQAAKASGAAHDKGRWDDESTEARHAVTRPLQAVEFDGHRLDLRLSIRFLDPLGYEQSLELNRIWILVIVDVFTRTVIDYHLVLASEYNRYDVIRTIQKALEPHRVIQFQIPGLGYGNAGGFPSQRLPELAWGSDHQADKSAIRLTSAIIPSFSRNIRRSFVRSVNAIQRHFLYHSALFNLSNWNGLCEMALD